MPSTARHRNVDPGLSRVDWAWLDRQLEPVLSILDGTQPEAGEALRELLESRTLVFRCTIHSYPVCERILAHFWWGQTPQGADYWNDVHVQFRKHVNTWFPDA